MSWIKDIENFDYVKKTFVIGLPVLTCFWYIGIYISNTEFLPRTQVFTIFIFAFGLAFMWYMACLIYSLLSFSVIEKRSKIQNKDCCPSIEQGTKTLTILILSTSILGIFIFLAYFLNVRFLQYAVIPFIIMIILIIFRMIQQYSLKKKAV